MPPTLVQSLYLTSLLDSVTEILDIAPVDFLAGLSKQTVAELPKGVLPEEQCEQALEIEFHWVNEKGGPAKLTGGLSVQATVRSLR